MMRGKLIKPACLAILVIIACTLSRLAGLNGAQTLAIAIFTLEIAGIAAYWEYKIAFASLALALFLILGIADIHVLIKAMNVDVLIFLIGMMVVVSYLENRGFFEHIAGALIQRAGRDAFRLALLLMLLSAAFSSVVGVVAAALLIVPITINLTLRYGADPTPLVLMAIFAANIGSSATIIGNPASILLAMRAGFTFGDFVKWSLPAALAALAALSLICLWMFRRELRALNRKLRAATEAFKLKEEAAENLGQCWALFICLLLVLTLHHTVEEVLRLPRGTMLVAIAMAFTAAVLFLERERTRDVIERGIDWYTLLFFALLFASIGALEQVGIPETIAEGLSAFASEHASALTLAIAFVSGILSSVLDNVLAVALLIPVIRSLEQGGSAGLALWWASLWGATCFSNLTIIASVANIIAVSILRARRIDGITFARWLRYGILTSIPPLLAAIALIMLY